MAIQRELLHSIGTTCIYFVVVVHAIHIEIEIVKLPIL